MTAPLTALILQQEHSYPNCVAIEQKVIQIKAQRRKQEMEDAERVQAKLRTCTNAKSNVLQW